MAMRRACVVTVGTTRFEELVSVAGGDEFLEILARRGFARLVLQVGSGAAPSARWREEQRGENGEEREEDGGGVFVHESGIEVEWFRFKREFAAVIAGADLVVSHAGSGSIFEALCAGRKLIVVVNTRLMHNHQRELADRLAQDGYLVASDCDGLCAALDELDEDALIPYQPGDPAVRRRGEVHAHT